MARASFPKWRTMRAHRGRNPIARGPGRDRTASREHRHEHSAEPSSGIQGNDRPRRHRRHSSSAHTTAGEHGHERQDRGASANPIAPPDAVAMLFDSTVCTGCKACMPACNEANGLPTDTSLSGGIWDMPMGLNAKTKNIIELYQDPQSDEFAFVKKQCMHCLDPACVTGCPFGSLVKRDLGAVTWDSSLCIGCRYCEVACPFEVPNFSGEPEPEDREMRVLL